jgi:hypothetical protein
MLFAGWLAGSEMRSQLIVAHSPVSRFPSMLWYSKIGSTVTPYVGKYRNNVISTNGKQRVRALSAVWVVPRGRYINPSSVYDKRFLTSVIRPQGCRTSTTRTCDGGIPTDPIGRHHDLALHTEWVICLYLVHCL